MITTAFEYQDYEPTELKSYTAFSRAIEQQTERTKALKRDFMLEAVLKESEQIPIRVFPDYMSSGMWHNEGPPGAGVDPGGVVGYCASWFVTSS